MSKSTQQTPYDSTTSDFSVFVRIDLLIMVHATFDLFNLLKLKVNVKASGAVYLFQNEHYNTNYQSPSGCS